MPNKDAFGAAVTIKDDDRFGAPQSVSPTGPRDQNTLNVPGGEGFPGVPNPIPKIIPETEVYEGLPQYQGSHYDPAGAMQPSTVRRRLEDYNEGGQLLTAAQAPLGAGAVEAIRAGGMPALLKIGRGFIGATAGAGIGGDVGANAGGLFGPTGRKVGGAIGAFGGGLLGGGLAAGLERNPTTSLQSRRGLPGNIRSLPFGIQRFVPEWMVPKGELGSETNAGPFSEIPLKTPKEVVRGTPVDPVRAAVKEGRASIIPTRMPKTGIPAEGLRGGRSSLFPTNAEGMTATNQPLATMELPPVPKTPQEPFPEVVKRPKAGRIPAEGVAGSVAKPSGRLVLLPEEANAENVMQRLAEQRASKHGMLYAAGMRPAGGGRVPFAPTGTVTPFAPERVPGIPQLPESTATGLEPKLRQEVQEFVTPSRAMQTPEWVAQEHSYEAQKAREILRNPKATAEEKAVAKSRLEENK